ncbi:hypothetical protein [Pseudomonas sp. CHM02]|uniref:hypothetical protein n=1 Tax=Pseudomonas sp. CHM02 TaxID=1463662 RepID=UPI0009DF876C|nr:hypothetical protein [Pseudomonas sp. CHM02]
MSKIPEGTQFIEAGCGEKGFRKFEKGCWWFYEGFWRHVDWKMGALTLVTEHPDYAAPAIIPWTGEGLPPVGTVCEVLWNESRMEYLRTKVFGVNEHGQPIHRFDEGPKKYMYQADVMVTTTGTKVFRPIRTPEQIEQQELREALEDLAPHIAGYMGRDDPAAVDVGLAAYLLDHGYRKQPSP